MFVVLSSLTAGFIKSISILIRLIWVLPSNFYGLGVGKTSPTTVKALIVRSLFIQGLSSLEITSHLNDVYHHNQISIVGINGV